MRPPASPRPPRRPARARPAGLGLALALAFSTLAAQQPPGPAPAAPAAPAAAPRPMTIIESEYLEMETTDKGNLFQFERNVRVIGNNLLVTCDRLTVVSLGSRAEARRDAGEASASAAPPGPAPKTASTGLGIGAIELIIASGNVEIFQDGRQALAGRAEVFPNEGAKGKKGKIVLTGDPKVVDDHGTVSGWRITLLQGEGRAIVEGNPEDPQGQKATVITKGVDDLGFPRRPGDAAPAGAPGPR